VSEGLELTRSNRAINNQVGSTVATVRNRSAHSLAAKNYLVPADSFFSWKHTAETAISNTSFL
jgi:hypothetical protein